MQNSKVKTQTALFLTFLLLNYSVLKLFTGLAIAAFIAWKLIVNNAINNAIAPAAANTHQLILILYAKSSSHLFINHQDRGTAMNTDIIIRMMKFLASIKTIPCTE